MNQESQIAVTQPVRVDVKSVETQLADMWRMAIGGCVPESAAPATRAILSNLLVYPASKAESREATEIINALIADHPARTIIADSEAGEPEHEADVSMLCSISERGTRLCGEEIRLHTHGLDGAALSIILPILVPDLPVYLWTPGDLVWDEKVSRYLTQIADHWIIDSRKFKHWVKEFSSASELGPNAHPPVALHDLAWISLTEWQEAIAQHFDTQQARQYLLGITNVEIAYKQLDESRPRIEALLLASWLAQRLGWREPQINGSSMNWTFVSADGSSVALNLKPRQDAPAPISSVRIECEIDGRRAEFRSILSEQGNEVSIEADAPDLLPVRHTSRFSQPSVRDDVRRALNVPGTEMLYQLALPLIREMVGEIG